jgi:hypothetical protein
MKEEYSPVYCSHNLLQCRTLALYSSTNFQYSTCPTSSMMTSIRGSHNFFIASMTLINQTYQRYRRTCHQVGIMNVLFLYVSVQLSVSHADFFLSMCELSNPITGPTLKSSRITPISRFVCSSSSVSVSRYCIMVE